MTTIKMFGGTIPPSLKKGEWASDGDYAYLGMGHGEYKVFEGIFEMGKTQDIAGFRYNDELKAIVIPSGSPFSRLQGLFDALPKSLKYNSNDKASIDILFEDGIFINDLGTNLILRDFSYQINFRALSNQVDEIIGGYEKPVCFQSDKAMQVYNSSVNFSDIRLAFSDKEHGALWFLNSSTHINDCCFDAQDYGACVSDQGYNKIVFSEAFFKMKTNEADAILDKASVGSFINIARCKSEENHRPRSIAKSLEGGFIIAGNIEDLNIKEKSAVFGPIGGVEIHGALVTNTNGGLDVPVPTKLSQLDNDLNFTGDYKELKNTPITISEGQAKAISENSKKLGYPKKDADKLKGIEEKATHGATKEQAEAIAENSKKTGYPKEDADKLKDIEEKATNGATKEQSEAIEANSKKLGYPKKDADKLKDIEEKATKGADWEENLKNKPRIIDHLAKAFADAEIVHIGYDKENGCLKIKFKDGTTTVFPLFLNLGGEIEIGKGAE